MNIDLHNKVAIVTGVGRGIGREGRFVEWHIDIWYYVDNGFGIL